MSSPPIVAASHPTAAASPAQAAERLTLLLESTGEGIFGIDMAGQCTFVNRAAAQMLGRRTEEVLGRNMHALMHHTHADGRHYPECDCPIFRAFRQGLPCRIDGEVLWRADGSCFPAEYSSHPIMENGEVRGAVATFVDITERKRAEELLRKSHDELEARVAERTRELRDLANHLEAVRETERKRIAREIHDELGSLLVALKMDTQWLYRRIEGRPELQAKCQGMGRLIDTAVDEVGRIITDLRPSILDHQGLWAALEWHAQEFIDAFADGSELDATLQVHVARRRAAARRAGSGHRRLPHLPGDAQQRGAACARAQPCRCASACMSTTRPTPVLYIDVRDDGVGAPAAALADPHSFGVHRHARARPRTSAGACSIDSAPGPRHASTPGDAVGNRRRGPGMIRVLDL